MILKPLTDSCTAPFKQKTAYEISACLVGSEMCIRDRPRWIGGQMNDSAERKANELLQLLGIEHRAHHLPNEMSGGEQQRVAIARALINEPALLLADEPTGNLDSANAAAVHELLLKLNKELGQTIVVVTHNKELAALGATKWSMTDGKLSE